MCLSKLFNSTQLDSKGVEEPSQDEQKKLMAPECGAECRLMRKTMNFIDFKIKVQHNK